MLSCSPGLHCRFQSTLPRRERQQQRSLIASVCDFNPRSREGSDIVRWQTLHSIGDFNPRSREGSDNIQGPFTRQASGISIHAPAKGATFGLADPKEVLRYFNPRSREGSDKEIQNGSTLVLFQSTLPRRERHYLKFELDTINEFQSTLPRRERLFSGDCEQK